jgi:hypothetical protein
MLSYLTSTNPFMTLYMSCNRYRHMSRENAGRGELTYLLPKTRNRLLESSKTLSRRARTHYRASSSRITL